MKHTTIDSELRQLAKLATDGTVREADVYAAVLRLSPRDTSAFLVRVRDRWRVRRAPRPLV